MMYERIGYFCNDEATASTVDSQGWLRTGDLCYIDDDGFIFVVDRLKELIKYKAFQVSERSNMHACMFNICFETRNILINKLM